MAITSTALANFDRRPFFDKALRYGLEQGIITPERLALLQEDFAKGMVQIANFFGTAHLRPELELAQRRMINLVSLYLENLAHGDLASAAASLRDKSFLAHSKAGSEMLKRLHALPESSLIFDNQVSAEAQRAFLDEKSAAESISLAKYLAELALRQENQNTIEFAFWLAKKTGIARTDVDDAESLIRSAMLVLFVDQAELQIPTRSAFVGLIKSAKNSKASLNETRLKAFLKEAPPDFERLAKQAMTRFIAQDLPKIRTAACTADKLLHGETAEVYFVRESLDDDVREYSRLVAKEWERVTRGESDDPAVLATLFLFLATGLPAKSTMLQREAKEVIQIFRTHGFNNQAVSDFIAEHAPEEIREDLQKTWHDDIRTEAEDQLADRDPNWPDTYMERSLEYLRKTCCAAWKGRRR